jgi:thiamine-monophosphate kinase
MTERELVSWIQKRAPHFGQRVPNGIKVSIGDDCAVYQPKPNEDLVFTTDFTIEDRHFTWKDYKPIDAGYKALARALSDLAAMAATPEFALVSLAARDECIVKGFMSGIFRCARHYNVTIAGGDLSKSDRLYCDITCAGRVPRGKAILRSGAKPGDYIYVTGPLGLWKKKPIPRLDLAPLLRKNATAAIDLSDGLLMDLERLLIASNAAAELSAPPQVQRGASLEQAWQEGESYEMLFTSQRRLALHRIGQIVTGAPGKITGENLPNQPAGWDPFGKLCNS